MNATPNRPSSLSLEERLALEPLLLDFDQRWHERLLAEIVGALPPEPLRHRALLELVRIDLEQAWTRGLRRHVEDYLAAHPELGTPATVAPALLLAEYQARRQAGSAVTIEEFAQRFPGHSEQLRQTVESENRAGVVEVPTGSYFPATTPPAEVQSLGGSLVSLECIGRYQLVRELGRGGMARVYLAHDPIFGRDVALKVSLLPSEATRKRFLREAQLLAKLEHPNICPIYDVGERAGEHFLVMEYLPEGTLADLLKPQAVLPLAQAAALVRKLALALQQAHDAGVLHRDLKPANVMMRAGEPVVTDFGLAVNCEQPGERLTVEGTILGTPAYMSPEQARGDIQHLTRASDIYSLGIILFEMLVGQVPFRGEVREVLRKVQLEAVPQPSALRTEVDPCLEAICLKALARAPLDRYESMSQFAAALEDWSKNPLRNPEKSEPPFQPPTVSPRTWPRTLVRVLVGWCVLVHVALALMVANRFGGGSQRPSDLPRQAPTFPVVTNHRGAWRLEGDELVQYTADANARLWFGDPAWTDYDFTFEALVVQGKDGFAALFRSPGPRQAHLYTLGWQQTRWLHAIEAIKPSGAAEETFLPAGPVRPLHLPLMRWQKIRVQARGDKVECSTDELLTLAVLNIPEPQGAVGLRTSEAAVRFRNIKVTAPDGQILLAGLPALPAHDPAPKSVVLSTRVVAPVASADQPCWRAHSGRVVQVKFVGTRNRLVSASDSSFHSRQLLNAEEFGDVWSSGSDNSLCLWSLDPSGVPIQRGNQPDVRHYCHNPLTDVAVSPDGKLGLSANSGNLSPTVRLWDLQKGQLLHSFREVVEMVVHVSFSADGKTARAVAKTGAMWTWDVKTGNLMTHREPIKADPGWGTLLTVDLSPSGDRLLAGFHNDAVGLFRAEDGSLMVHCSGHKGRIHNVKLSADGGWALSGGADKTIRKWNLKTGRQLQEFLGHEEAIVPLAISPDEKRCLSGSDDSTVRLWDINTGKQLQCFQGHTGIVRGVAFSPDGKRAASGAEDQTIRLWDLPE